MDRLDLLGFVPFRLNRLAAEFSGALAADYARYGIDIPEWRVMATLGQHETPRSAGYVVRCTRTHKSRISRAVSHLIALGFVAREENDDDRREVMLREERLLACLSQADRRELGRLLLGLEASLGLMRCGEEPGGAS
jgi:DNA-binding MarR family transcriptional regulator